MDQENTFESRIEEIIEKEKANTRQKERYRLNIGPYLNEIYYKAPDESKVISLLKNAFEKKECKYVDYAFECIQQKLPVISFNTFDTALVVRSRSLTVDQLEETILKALKPEYKNVRCSILDNHFDYATLTFQFYDDHQDAIPDLSCFDLSLIKGILYYNRQVVVPPDNFEKLMNGAPILLRVSVFENNDDAEWTTELVKDADLKKSRICSYLPEKGWSTLDVNKISSLYYLISDEVPQYIAQRIINLCRCVIKYNEET